ncbi:alpha-L-rhamnosidase [Actinoplanes lutulentus]|uniref:alpha-L-rhamnosidase n=1 Tax=Actinoplanes lutulentus TaxID=1287878 RepID=A0A327ZJN1_9ACTN|nr:glycoside hydrolase family 78 protein [Actinoplanes lutulentus]MBB2940731.1 alpha-L-rhamnosidase [Actinoplanes lutulentus]RAK43042.1 alpha-L-rhamnosidase [Actinoplanes lutulentus]
MRAPRIEHHTRPIGIGECVPRLSWQVETDQPGWRQQAYEIQGDGWTSGRIDAADSVLVPWPGPALVSRERVEIRVRVWAEGSSEPTAWSPPTAVEAGLLDPGEWQALFVGSADISQGDRRPILLRRDFSVRPDLIQARVYATASGVYELELNGERAGDDVLAPGWTSYHHRLNYQTYDVTGLLRPGANTITGWLADGWWRGEFGWNRVGERYGSDTALMAQLELVYADGTVERVVTDDSWTWAYGPILSSSIYDGERYDARVEAGGWSRVQKKEGPEGELISPAGPPVRRVEELAPVSVRRVDDDTHLLDFGQNLAGRLRITVAGPAGTEIGMRHAEVLEDGRLCLRPIRTADAHDVYVLAGDGVETWEPRFTYHGFRYAEITGWPGSLDAGSVVAVVCHDDMIETGQFACSDPLLERLHENVRWSMRDNFVSVPTDCPQRDERLGWTGDLQVFAPTAAFLYDVTGKIGDWLADVAAETGDDGLVPLYVPHIPTSFPQFHCAVWGDVTTVVPLVLLDLSGDTNPVVAGYETAQRWVEGCRRLLNERDVIDSGMQLGDWLDPAAPSDAPAQARTDPYLVATAYLAYSARLLARQARLVGKDDDEVRYAELAEAVTLGFRREFATASGRCVSDTQTAYALAICFGLLPAEQRVHAGDRLAQLVREAEFRIGTGFAGTPLVLDALTDTGHLEEAYRLLLSRDCPSWLYPVTMGATTIWERWDSMLPDGTINPGNMTSFNHYALGAVADWMHRVVGGLAPAAPGYRSMLVRPRPGGGLSSASARHLTPYGPAEVSWRRSGGKLLVDVVVPPGCDATVDLPGSSPVAVLSGRHHFEVDHLGPDADPLSPLPPRQRF